MRWGFVPSRLKCNGFDDLSRHPALGGVIPLGDAPLAKVEVGSADDFVVGDHVVFYNHASYDALVRALGGIWRLENAVVIDAKGGDRRYQGHGYFSPVSEDHLLAGMFRQYNKHVDAAKAIINRIERSRTTVDRQRAEAELGTKYPAVRRKSSGPGWEIAGLGFGRAGVWGLQHLSKEVYRRLGGNASPWFISPFDGKIWARRPAQGLPWGAGSQP